MQAHKTVSREEWLEARRALLAKEKEVLKAKDALRQETRELPWVKVDKEYVFEGPNGRETLSDLFAGRSQLVVRHFMLGPGWKEGCVGCSFGADQTDGSVVHLINHDVMFVTVSRAPYPEIAAYHKRMGWTFKWVSSFGSDFNFDYHVSFTEEDEKRGKAFYNFADMDYMGDEMPGTSVFFKNEAGEIFHTYSAFARGSELIGGVYGILDVTPKGRNEPPGGNLTAWVRRHDEYAEKPGDSCCHG
ncbi:MAG TPA: thioredoxin family protein [Reyranella sp.]|nr:thioredoxin family protein [Reyranella sp.]